MYISRFLLKLSCNLPHCLNTSTNLSSVCFFLKTSCLESFIIYSNFTDCFIGQVHLFCPDNHRCNHPGNSLCLARVLHLLFCFVLMPCSFLVYSCIQMKHILQQLFEERCMRENSEPWFTCKCLYFPITIDG